MSLNIRFIDQKELRGCFTEKFFSSTIYSYTGRCKPLTLASAEKLTHVELLSLKVVVYPAPLAFIGGAPPTCGYMWTKEDTFAAADILSKNQYGKTIVDRKPLIIKFNIASYLKQKGLPTTIPLLDTYIRDTFSKLFAEAPKLVIWGF